MHHFIFWTEMIHLKLIEHGCVRIYMSQTYKHMPLLRTLCYLAKARMAFLNVPANEFFHSSSLVYYITDFCMLQQGSKFIKTSEPRHQNTDNTDVFQAVNLAHFEKNHLLLL